jgi:hypothetical protein
MARDAKLVFQFVQNAGTVGSGIGVVQNATATATTAFNASYLSVPASMNANGFVRATSNALNRSGFRDQTADQSVLSTSNSVVSAILNDPSVFGNTEMYEAYARITYGYAFPASPVGVFYLVIEAASDSGTGTAGTDWTPVGSSINLTPTSTLLGSAANTTLVNGLATFSATHNLSVGQMVVFTAGTSPAGFALGQPLYVVSIPAGSTTTANLSTVPNVLNTGLGITGGSGTVIGVVSPNGNPGGKRMVSVSIAPTAKPWLRLALHAFGTGSSPVQYSGVWIQDAFVTIGRDSAALA